MSLWNFVLRTGVQNCGKPWLVLDFSQNPSARDLIQWIQQHQIQILNVAGLRESQSAGIYQRAYAFLKQAFKKSRLG